MHHYLESLDKIPQQIGGKKVVIPKWIGTGCYVEEHIDFVPEIVYFVPLSYCIEKEKKEIEQLEETIAKHKKLLDHYEVLRLQYDPKTGDIDEED